MVGATPDSVLAAMVGAGIPREEAGRELELAVSSPYVRGSELLLNRLQKREWLLAAYRKLDRLQPGSSEVARRHRPSRAEFLEGYYAANRPLIITGMMDDWPALRKWGLDYFAGAFGDRMVEVQCGRTAGDDYEVDSRKYTRTMPFAAFLDRVRAAGVSNDLYLTAGNHSQNRRALPELWDDIVQVPEYLDVRVPGGFLWMGPAGTITPFHHDLTNNLMAQVVGRKRVRLAPSCDMPLMRNHYHVFSQVDGRVAAPSPYAGPDRPRILECILEPGEVLFLPVGWMHFVEGLDVTATVTFTNFAFDNDFSSNYATYRGV
jgi:hypothetical protein